MIDTEKIKALASKLGAEQVGDFGEAYKWMKEAADAIDTLLADLESATACCDSYASENQRLFDEAEAARTALEAAAADKREMIDLLKQIPQTPEQMIDFIGSNFNSMEADGWTDDKFPPEPTGDLYNVKYSLTVHDLLSAFSCHGFEDAVTLSQRQEEGS